MMADKVLVLGGTGLLGGAAARALLAGGYQVRVMTRGVAAARERTDPVMELVEGDVSDLASLRQAMKGCTGVHISVGGPVDRLSAENACTLAGKQGIRHLTYISGATVCEANRWFPMVAQKLEAEELIRDSGLPYTIFCPTWPMEMLVRFVRAGRPVLIGAQPYPIHWYAADELGRMVAAAYGQPEAQNKRFTVHGPEGIPMKEALQRYCARLCASDAKVSVMPICMAKAVATLTGNAELKFAAPLMAYFGKVGEMGDPTEANEILGAPSIRLDEWIASREKAGVKGGT